MKAKFVFEDLNFQKGLDPKAALGVGKYRFPGLDKFEALMKKTPFKLDWDFMANSQNEYRGVLSDDSTMTSLQVYSYDIPNSNNEKTWIELFHEEGIPHQLYVMVDNPDGVEDYTLEKFLLIDYHSLFESINFQRGMPPKKALDVGGIIPDDVYGKMKIKFQKEWAQFLKTLIGKKVSFRGNKFANIAGDKFRGGDYDNHTVIVEECDSISYSYSEFRIKSTEGDWYSVLADEKMYIDNV